MILLYTKISIVLTVIYAGLNTYQITNSYAYLLEKIAEFKALTLSKEAEGQMKNLGWIFYVILPLGYLILLYITQLKISLLVLCAVKFVMTAAMGWWTERSVFEASGYTRKKHVFNQVDNVLNLGMAVAIVYGLLYLG